MTLESNKNSNREIEVEKREPFIKKYKWHIVFILFEAIVILCFALFFTYGIEVSPLNAGSEDSSATTTMNTYYPLFQDVHVMVFIGFGFLMTYLKSHSWNSVGMNFLLGAWSIQLSLLFLGLWKAVFTNSWDHKIELDIKHLIDADYAAASVLITFGAVIGKFSMPQYMVMNVFQTFFYSLNFELGTKIFYAADIGGSMYIHAFGAYFGLAMSWAVFSNDEKSKNHPKNRSGYTSNLFAMIGTLFLWMYWPSFNGALGVGNSRHRVIINTYLALTGSCFGTYILSSFLKNKKLHMEDILNATISGGVIIGTCCDFILSPWASILIGFGGAIISVFGFEWLTGYLTKKFKIFDNAGIHNLHGTPGFMGGILGAITIGTVTKETFGDSVQLLLPKSAVRSAGLQAGYQLAALAATMGISIVTGLITGWVLKLSIFEPPKEYFDDKFFWHMEEEDPVHNLVIIHEPIKENNSTRSKHSKNVPSENEPLKVDGKIADIELQIIQETS